MSAYSQIPLCFRAATVADLPALVELEAATFELHRIDRRHFLRLLRSQSVYCLVVCPRGKDREQEILGYALVFLRRGKSRARLYSLAVDQAVRGQGIGQSIVKNLMTTLATVGQTRLSLEVRTEDDAANRFYERLGFRLMQRLPGYYDDGAEALRLVVSLTSVTRLKTALAG